MMGHSEPLLAEFARLRTRLSDILTSEADIFENLGDAEGASRIAKAESNLADDRFRIIVMGEMKRGKSTLINAMLGEGLMPSLMSIACTAVPISVKHGERKRAVCYPRTDSPLLHCDLPEETLKFVEAVTVPPKSRRVGPDDDAWAIRTHPYKRAEVFAPLELLRNGVELHDTAGLNEDSRRSEETWQQADQADAIFLVLDCNKIDLQSDREDLQRIWSARRDPRVVFVVWNHTDDIRRKGQEAVDRIKEAAITMIEPMGVPIHHIVFVSAEEALEGRVQGDIEKVDQSGVPEFEKTLNDFLLRDRSSSKLLNPLNVAEHALGEALMDVLTRRADAWVGPAQKLLALSRLAKNHLHEARRVRGRLESKLKRSADVLAREAARTADTFVEDHREGIEEAVDDTYIKNSDAIFHARSSVEKLVEAVESRLKKQSSKWERKRLAPLVTEYESEVQQHVAECLTELRNIHAAVVELEQEAVSSNRQRDPAGEPGDDLAAYSINTGAFARQFTSVDGDGLPGDAPIAGIGVGAMLGGGAGLWLAMIFAPHIMLPVVAAAIVGAFLGGKSAANILKGRTVTAIIKAMHERASELKSHLRSRVAAGCKEEIRS